jgi:beta-lactamase class A
LCWTLRGPALRHSAGRALPRAAALSAAVALVAALVCSCAPTPAPPAHGAAGDDGLHIDTHTPPGLRAKQTVDMLNSDWPIGPIGVRTLASPDMVDNIGTVMDGLWWDRPFSVAGVDVGAGQATIHLVSSVGANQDIEIHTNDDGLVDRFELTTQKPPIKTWRDVDATLTRSGARYSYQVAKVNDGKCEPIAGTNTRQSLPLASIFKLYVLYAVADAVKAGTASWDDLLTITGQAKAVGSSGLEKLPPGAQVTVRTAAQKMISNSDNMATDLLIGRVGTHAIEKALVEAGHHDPASMTPFPTMHEMFSVGWGEPDLREQWKQAADSGGAQAREQLLEQTNSRPYEPDPARTHTPASSYGAEWYGSAEDICRVHAALQTGAVGAAAPVKEIVSAIAGIDLDRTEWPYIGAKAGNLPGDLTFSWYAVDRTGQPWVLSLQMNWPRYHGPSTAGWLMTIVKQMFAMVPVGG